MREQKAFTSERIYWAVEQVEREAGDIDDLHLDDNLFYLKSEADKVIAELKDKLRHYPMMVALLESDKKEIAELKHSLELASNECCSISERGVKNVRHEKYKRCMAMAKWCKDKVDAIKNGYMISGIADRYGVMTTCPPECNPKFSFYEKWHKRWLELAKHYKEMAK